MAGILASGMHRQEEVSLLFDVGTNGEVVLGNRDWRIACSSSAGPAFEGGEVGCGMRAYPGAIESVRIEPGTAAAEWTVIGRGRPAGLCGSGILDLCAELFRAGIVDRSGRFTSRGGGAPLHGARRSVRRGPRGEERHGPRRGLLRVGPEKRPADEGRPLRGRRGAARRGGAPAGGGGARLRRGGVRQLPRPALRPRHRAVPPIPLARFAPLGNASLAGALGALRNRRRWKEALSLASGTLYHDLSSDPGFMELYQRGLFLPHTDEESYRSVLAAEVSR